MTDAANISVKLAPDGGGGNASLNSTPNAAINGDAGFVIETPADPVSLF